MIQDSKIQKQITNFVGNLDVSEAFKILYEAGGGQLEFQTFVKWAFGKNMMIEYEKAKKRAAEAEDEDNNDAEEEDNNDAEEEEAEV